MSIDFERAKLLMEIVVSAGQHGPMYQKLASEAGKELKEMIDDRNREDRIVTPPEGPANGAIEHPDGTIERLPPAPLDNTVTGQRSELTGEDLNARARRMADQAKLPGDDEAIARKEELDRGIEARQKYQEELARTKQTPDADVRRKV